jgi:hypothetical protein
MAKERIGKTDSGAPSAEVPIAMGETAAEGQRQGEAGNAEFNRGLAERSGAAGHRDYRPATEGQGGLGPRD